MSNSRILDDIPEKGEPGSVEDSGDESSDRNSREFELGSTPDSFTQNILRYIPENSDLIRSIKVYLMSIERELNQVIEDSDKNMLSDSMFREQRTPDFLKGSSYMKAKIGLNVRKVLERVIYGKEDN